MKPKKPAKVKAATKHPTLIPCQAKHVDGAGCYTCRGYGNVLQQSTLVCCGKRYWYRPDSGYTVYEGKEWTSFDGVDVVWTLAGTACAECYRKQEAKP